jgi:hypothetical protein
LSSFFRIRQLLELSLPLKKKMRSFLPKASEALENVELSSQVKRPSWRPVAFQDPDLPLVDEFHG